MALQIINPTIDTTRLARFYHIYAWSLCIVVVLTEMVNRPLDLDVLGRKYNSTCMNRGYIITLIYLPFNYVSQI